MLREINALFLNDQELQESVPKRTTKRLRKTGPMDVIRQDTENNHISTSSAAVPAKRVKISMFDDAVQQDLNNEKTEERCEVPPTPNSKIVICTSEAPTTSDFVAVVRQVKFGEKSANGCNTDKEVHKNGISETASAVDNSVTKTDSGIQPSNSSGLFIFETKYQNNKTTLDKERSQGSFFVKPPSFTAQKKRLPSPSIGPNRMQISSRMNFAASSKETTGLKVSPSSRTRTPRMPPQRSVYMSHDWHPRMTQASVVSAQQQLIPQQVLVGPGSVNKVRWNDPLIVSPTMIQPPPSFAQQCVPSQIFSKEGIKAPGFSQQGVLQTPARNQQGVLASGFRQKGVPLPSFSQLGVSALCFCHQTLPAPGFSRQGLPVPYFGQGLPAPGFSQQGLPAPVVGQQGLQAVRFSQSEFLAPSFSKQGFPAPGLSQLGLPTQNFIKQGQPAPDFIRQGLLKSGQQSVMEPSSNSQVVTNSGCLLARPSPLPIINANQKFTRRTSTSDELLQDRTSRQCPEEESRKSGGIRSILLY